MCGQLASQHDTSRGGKSPFWECRKGQFVQEKCLIMDLLNISVGVKVLEANSCMSLSKM